jgi:ubiquinone/menaquinone biosynthesis C-methylase UbiE
LSFDKDFSLSGQMPFGGFPERVRLWCTGAVHGPGSAGIMLPVPVPYHQEGAETGLKRRRFLADDPERKEWQDPDAILSSIGLSEGMVFIDIGCGEGYFALPACRRVGKKGAVYAIDINADAVARLQVEAATEGLHNLYADVMAAEKAVICQRCADIVFFGIDLHDLADPLTVLKNAKEMLKQDGRVADLDWKDAPMDVGPPPEKRFSEKKARSLIESAGLAVQSVQDAGPYHYLILAGR